MKLHNLENRSTKGYTTFGSVWNKGELFDSSFILTSQNGNQIPVQSKVTAWWPDKSIKWAKHTANSSLIGQSGELTPADNAQDCSAPALPLKISDETDNFVIENGCFSLSIPKRNCGDIAQHICYHKTGLTVHRATPTLLLEHPAESEADSFVTKIQRYKPAVTSVELEESGPLQCVFCLRGGFCDPHSDKADGDYADVSTVTKSSVPLAMPFVIRMYISAQSEDIKFVHTFLYNGNEQHDFLKGMGISFTFAPAGKAYNRHVEFVTDTTAAQNQSLPALFHEAAVILNCNHPKLDTHYLARQLAGQLQHYTDNGNMADTAASDLPIWNNYRLTQDSAQHYSILKQTQAGCCELTCFEGRRAPGAAAVTSDNGGLLFGIKDFWEKNPSELELKDLGGDEASCNIWFYSPHTQAYDFRHYAKQSYPMSSYEGFKELGASAVGISVTSECMLSFTDCVPTPSRMQDFVLQLRKPPVYVSEPEYYHKKHAFGYFSLPKYATTRQKRIEGELEKAFDFYKNEVESRGWYGLFDYGDVMHTYDALRHCWRYDMGGYAWQNTELVPTYWLWLYFLRTGREDVYTLAEKMSRHCSEVDIYHFGDKKGLGSRHNVRHWGCPCKEPRVAMAGHHRFLYYLTGDERIGDVMEDVKDADIPMISNIHYQVTLADGTKKLGMRSGPDWSSLVSNWLTHYERTLDDFYRKKIETGISDICATPFGLASGPDYFYDFESSHLIYKGESENTANQHLQICMGGPQIWLETALMLDDNRLPKLLAQLGAFYLRTPQEKARLTDGKIMKRPFSWPMFAAGIIAYASYYLKQAGNLAAESDKVGTAGFNEGNLSNVPLPHFMEDCNAEDLAKQAWELIDSSLSRSSKGTGYEKIPYAFSADGTPKYELPWVTTNETAQWCLNAMMCLEFCPDTQESDAPYAAPKPLDYAKEACDTLMRKFKPSELPPKGHFHYHQGVFLSGMYEFFKCQKERNADDCEKYFSYMKEWVDSCLDEHGIPKDYNAGQLDDIQPGVLLFPLYERTGEARYKAALDNLMNILRRFPRNKEHGFWHKEWYPDQMWLDGLYMAGPIAAEYAKRFNAPDLLDITVEQIYIMCEKTRDEKTGLWHHAYDCERIEPWADSQTGRSPEFWGRSIGWVPVAILNDMDFMDKSSDAYKKLENIVRDLLVSICRYQSADGRWYQVIDKGDRAGNWLENSCSCLFVAALCKAVKEGILDASYLDIAKKGYDAVIRTLNINDGNLMLGGVCIGTGVSDYDYYINRPTSINDLHGMGAFLLMCTQMEK